MEGGLERSLPADLSRRKMILLGKHFRNCWYPTYLPNGDLRGPASPSTLHACHPTAPALLGSEDQWVWQCRPPLYSSSRECLANCRSKRKSRLERTKVALRSTCRGGNMLLLLLQHTRYLLGATWELL